MPELRHRLERRDFNPLSLYRERLKAGDIGGWIEKISIHSPYTGRDKDCL